MEIEKMIHQIFKIQEEKVIFSRWHDELQIETTKLILNC